MLGDHQHVFTPLTERRQHDRHHIQAVIQVLSESPLRDLLFQILLCGAHQPDIRLDRVVATDTFELPFLENPQELDLHHGRDLSDLIQKQRAFMGQLEPASPLPKRTREGPFLMAE